VLTPLAWLAERVTLGPRALRWGTTAALVASILIVLGGGIVRVTGSGLGCPSWPACTPESLTPIPELGIHGVIEFTNRLVTGLLIAAVGWAIIAARLQRPQDRTVTRLAWSQFWLVVANAVAGGFTVIFALNPWMVATHFVLAIGLLTTATLTWHRARVGTPPASEPPTSARPLAWALTATTLALVIVGTMVSGSGPHSGDSSDVPRMGLDWTSITIVHATLAVAAAVLAISLLFVLGGWTDGAVARRRVLVFLVIFVAQGAIGGVQALIGIPEVLVALHLLGAALVWVGVIRVLLDVDTRLFRAAPAPSSEAASQTKHVSTL
jgi:cytochrome c oxidase assembly protein subunit 15